MTGESYRVGDDPGEEDASGANYRPRHAGDDQPKKSDER